MNRTIALVGAPTSIGIKPYDDGTQRRLDLGPAVLRDEGLVDRLGARDLGDVLPPPYVDFDRPPGRPRNEEGVAHYSRSLADRVRAAREDDGFVLVLGGDCSIVLGALLGARPPAGRVGLVYIDAHGDFATPETSRTGSVASMCLALAVGRGDSPLARLAPGGPLVRPEDLVVIGRRDDGGDFYYGQDVLRAGPMLDLPNDAVRASGVPAAAAAALERLAASQVDGFWIHVDADVIDPSVMPAVDSPEPDGLLLDDLAGLLAPMVDHPKALGLELTIYDPKLDPDRSCAARLAQVLERVLKGL